MADQFGFTIMPSSVEQKPKSDQFGFTITPAQFTQKESPSLRDLMPYFMDIMSGKVTGNNVPPGLGQRLASVLQNAPSATMTGITELPKVGMSAITDISNLPSAGMEILNRPSKMIPAVGRGLVGLGENVVNYPSDIGEILQYFGAITPEESKSIPRVNPIEFDRTNGTGGEQSIEDVIKNLPILLGGGSIAKKLVKGAKLTKTDIVNNVLNKEKEAKNIYSGEGGHYPNLFDEARNRGANPSSYNASKIDINTFNKYLPDKKIEAVQEFLDTPTLENGQQAISELGFTKRALEKKDSLLPYEKKLLTSTNNAINHIQESMFTDSSGNLMKDLVDKHNLIQQGYAKDVIPYTGNKNIKAYKRNELTKEALIENLSRKNSKFLAQKGNEHPELGRYHTIKRLGKITGIGAGSYAGLSYLKSLLNKSLPSYETNEE